MLAGHAALISPGASAFGHWELCVGGRKVGLGGRAGRAPAANAEDAAGDGDGPLGGAPLSSVVQAAPAFSAPKAAPQR